MGNERSGVLVKPWTCASCQRIVSSEGVPRGWVVVETGYIITPFGMPKNGPYCADCKSQLDDFCEHSDYAFEIHETTDFREIRNIRSRQRKRVLRRHSKIDRSACCYCGGHLEQSDDIEFEFESCNNCGRRWCVAHHGEKCICRGRGLKN